jgi:hypothetical protein
MYPIIVRTAVQITVAFLLGQAAKYGFNLPEGAVTEIATVVIGTAYVALAHWVETNWPAVGKWLTSLGLTGAQPSYAKPVKAGRKYADGGVVRGSRM